MANEKRLIYLEDAKEALTGWETDPTDEEIEYTLDNLPTVDAVEVVLCKDCKHYKSTLFCNFHKHRIEEIGTCTRFRFGWGSRIGKPDDFCSYGERREGE